MRILFPISSFYPSQQGGPCNSVYALAKSLAAAGHQVFVLTTNYNIPEQRWTRRSGWALLDGIRVYYLWLPSNASVWTRELISYSMPWLFWGRIEEARPDIIHLTMNYTGLSQWSARYALRKGVPAVWSPRGELFPAALRNSTAKRIRKSLFFRTRSVRSHLRAVRAFHVTSEAEREAVETFLSSSLPHGPLPKICDIPNLADPEIFATPTGSYPYPDQYILFLGRISRIKNVEALIAGYARMRRRDGVKLVIAGRSGEDPEYTSELRTLVSRAGLSSHVVFTERSVEGDEKRYLYRHAKVCVLPSRSENFGMVVLESLAQGTPVIASRNTPWRALEERHAGYWVEADPESLAAAMDSYLDLPRPDRAVIRANGRSLAEEFGSTRILTRYLELYRQAMNTEA
jgi:glycosyltransferase involved in cell wall biosynthesis